MFLLERDMGIGFKSKEHSKTVKSKVKELEELW